jgi:hypothetical protein
MTEYKEVTGQMSYDVAVVVGLPLAPLCGWPLQRLGTLLLLLFLRVL